MASQTLEQLATAVTRMTDVAASAKAVIDGIATRVQTAIDAALANGATAAELEPVQAEVTALNASADALAASVQANT